MRRVDSQAGFTIVELVVVGAISIVLLIGAMILVHPNSYSAQKQAAQRRLDVAKLQIALARYQADHDRALPPGITADPLLISDQPNQANICSALVPKYLTSLPFDPALGVGDSSSCSNYTAGYSIFETDGYLTIQATTAQGQAEISITRKI